MARNRQRAKERQAARRAARQEGRGDGQTDAELTRSARDGGTPDPVDEAEFTGTAPPEDTGRSDTVLEPLPPEPGYDDDIDEAGDRELELAAEEAGAFSDEPVEEIAPETATGPRGVRGGDAAAAGEERSGFGKVLLFFQNVWAELQRVQWPDRKQVTTLTGVVLGFVLIAGGYLGLLDAIFSRVIDAII